MSLVDFKQIPLNMSLVDFKQIPLYEIDYDSNEPPVLTAGVEAGWPSGPHTGIIYNPLWGYFTFEQSLKFDYKKSNTNYVSNGVFTIKGVFTVNAEFPPPSGNLDSGVPPSPEDPSTGYDETRFRRLQINYDELRALFGNAARSEAPDDVSKYGTAEDQRCVPLPDPLRDKNTERVYARPVSLRIDETEWPNLISYTAVLEEPIVPPCKVTVEEMMINKGVIAITIEKPRIHIQNFSFANSAEIFFTGWNSPQYNVTGYLPEVPPSGALSTKNVTNMINNLMDGRVTVGKAMNNFRGADPSGQIVSMFSDLFVDSSSVSVTPNETDQGTKISFNAKE